jgi:hypothetical protein
MPTAWQYTDPYPLSCRPAARRHVPRHARPGIILRGTRAAIRGAARVVAFPLFPAYVVYRSLQPAWSTHG